MPSIWKMEGLDQGEEFGVSVNVCALPQDAAAGGPDVTATDDDVHYTQKM